MIRTIHGKAGVAHPDIFHEHQNAFFHIEVQVSVTIYGVQVFWGIGLQEAFLRAGCCGRGSSFRSRGGGISGNLMLLAEFLNPPVHSFFLRAVCLNRLFPVFLQACGRNRGQFPFPPGCLFRRQGAYNMGRRGEGLFQAGIQFPGQGLDNVGGNAVGAAAGKASGQGQQQGGKFFIKRNGYLLR